MQMTEEMQFWSLGREDHLEEEMATNSSAFAWRIPWTGEPGGLRSTGWQRTGRDEVTEHTCAHTHTQRCIKLDYP